jgi:hypothetical protein
VVVNSDPLDQIAATALGKKVISLYSPTNYRRIVFKAFSLKSALTVLRTIMLLIWAIHFPSRHKC